MSTTDKPRDLLDELETLQRVLDDAATDQVDQDKIIPTLDPMTDIPVLDDLFGIDDTADLTLPSQTDSQSTPLTAVPAAQKQDAAPALKNVNSGPALRAVPDPAPEAHANNDVQSPIPEHFDRSSVTIPKDNVTSTSSSNPFLPKAILEKLAQEREAAQYSAEQAQATMAKIMSNAPEEPFRFDHEKQRASTDENGISSLEKAAVIDELVKEMLPEIEARLRKALHDKL